MSLYRPDQNQGDETYQKPVVEYSCVLHHSGCFDVGNLMMILESVLYEEKAQ